ncbi:MAG TPA: hypothetical protein VNB06_09020 [Thermoanaerobaculia bacterium]|nr:hypothetical protein [Thermoanaerobaculia bacterium]
MELTSSVAKVIGPVLLLRALSLVIDRRHFLEMLRGLERAILIHLIAWGGMAKASALILFPGAVAVKARALERVGFLNVVLAVCFLVGGYFTWFGYFGS